MDSFSKTDVAIGSYCGRLNQTVMQAKQMEWIEELAVHLQGEGGEVLTSGRNLNVRLYMPFEEAPVSVVVKAFGGPGVLQTMRAKRIGSKARRTWMAAVHLTTTGVGTPRPLAFLERWEGRRLVESYVVTAYQAKISSFAHELDHLYRQEPDCAKLMTLLDCVATAIRAMHDSGFVHYDLGNQNVLLHRTGDCSWGEVQFIDLNRGRIRPMLTDRERGRDLSRITLPSDFLRVFKEMYYGGQVVPPETFQRWESHYRRRYAWHSWTRRWRHPIREARRKAAPGDPPRYPAAKDIWIWDERSGQAIPTMVSRDRARHYPFSRNLLTVLSSLRALPAVWRAYQRQLASAFGSRVEMRGRIGVAVEVLPGDMDRKLALLAAMGPIPVFVRFYHHRGRQALEETAAFVEALAGRGHSVSIALVQDRRAVCEPDRWREFVDTVLTRVGHLVALVEAGHAINRVKWGVWDYREYRRLMEPFAAWKIRCPHMTFGGPAMIDFEYAYIPAALDRLPGDFKVDVLTHHLYVDRRGAPETPQGRFAALEKFALARAEASCHRRCKDRLVVSEFNWPLAGTGVYSPVGSPYFLSWFRLNESCLIVFEAAAYLLRYVLTALCSGLVERVFWWRLVARGYGLVDDTDSENWRVRPAYQALLVLLGRLQDSIFTERVVLPDVSASGAEGIAYGFEKPAGDGQWWIVYTTAEACLVHFSHPVSSVTDAFGTEIVVDAPGMLPLSGMPVYVE